MALIISGNLTFSGKADGCASEQVCDHRSPRMQTTIKGLISYGPKLNALPASMLASRELETSFRIELPAESF